MSRPIFVNIRALATEQERNKVKAPFQTFFRQNGVYGESSMNAIGGQIFALMERGRSVGGVWVRHWPSQPQVGDVHVAVSKYRFRDYATLVAFDLLLHERAQVMGVKKWRVIVKAEDAHVIRALGYLRFGVVSEQNCPGVGDVVILEREVI